MFYQKGIQLILYCTLLAIIQDGHQIFDFYANAHISLTIQPTMLILVSAPRFPCMRNPFRTNQDSIFIPNGTYDYTYKAVITFFQPRFPKQLANRCTLNRASYNLYF